jgi:hypothetical protein
MQDVLKQLNDRNPSDVRILDERALRRFEALCEAWGQNRRSGTCTPPVTSVPSVSIRRANLIL